MVATVCAVVPGTLSSRCVSALRRFVTGGALPLSYLVNAVLAYREGRADEAIDAMRRNAGSPYLNIGPVQMLEALHADDLAEAWSASALHTPWFHGASDEDPRAALRAERMGRHDLARERAQRVITAWEGADAPIPAIPTMRALLVRLDAHR